MPFEIEDGALAIRIEDMASRFNLNALAGPQSAQNLAALKRLLAHLGIDVEAADAWLDWIDGNQDVNGSARRTPKRCCADPPRRTADQPAVHVSEFLVAATLTAKELALLRPHVAVLPVVDLRVNVNTATATVLGSLAPNFPAADAERLAAGPREFALVEEVVADHAALGESAGVLAVTGEFFRVRVRVELGDSRTVLTTVIHRDPESGALATWSRSFGERFEDEHAPAG